MKTSMKTVDHQKDAFLYLFMTILQENGYYNKLRHFMKVRGYNWADMACMLYNAWFEDAPDGMSVYWFMDSLEDYLCKYSIRGMKDIDDIVQACYGTDSWKCN